MDKQFSDKLRAYMEKPENERDLNEGAIMLLQINRNRILHQNITRNPSRYAGKLFYELGKHLKIHSDDMTIAGIVEMEKQVPEIEVTTLKNIQEVTDEAGTIALGKRADHDDLPESIKALWVQNGELARLMKSQHEKLKLMCDMQPCDRYETLQLLINTDKKYRQNWKQYDDFVLRTGAAQTGEQGTHAGATGESISEKVPFIDANRVSANRKFISLGKGRVAKYKEVGDLPNYHALLEKIQVRYDELKAAGCALDEKQLNELVDLGLKA